MQIKNWKMNFTEHNDIECNAPCSIYSVLLENKLISDPFYGCNELEVTSLSEEDCEFYSEFYLTDDILEKEYVELVFYGLDTICDIFVNDKLIAHTENMHRRYTFDIKNYAIYGTNSILLKFSSPLNYYNKMWNRKHVFKTAETYRGLPYLRKAFYMSGWDWGPTLPDMGIFRDVEISAYNTDKIENTVITQTHKNGAVELSFEVSTVKKSGLDIYAEIDGKKIKLENSFSTIRIDDPRLWWVRGYGDQTLYDITFTIEKDGNIIDSVTKRIGLRTLTVCTEKEGDGEEFCFVINGVKIFSMGANYIPQDNILSRITPDRLERMIEDCIFANYNTIRVWGGGYYPDDRFFDICDEKGIIVWQDFMVACLNIRLTEKMREEIIEEAVYNLNRISHHASLGILSGNNELETMVDSQKDMLVKQEYLEIYERILPDIAEKYAPDTFYWPSSPSSGGGFDEPQAHNRGDVHYWEVWHGNKPFEDYRNHKFRFCSEYGFESLPNIKTIRSFAEEKDLNLFSPVMENHQKCPSGNRKILMYLADNYLYPTSFESLVYASQLLQADAIRYGVEWFRRLRGYTMGSIYWQVNDCWPVASWSSVDYYGRYKALHYAARKFYAPIALGIFNVNDNISVNIANETRSDQSIRLAWGIARHDNTVISSGEVSCSVNALSSKDVISDITLAGIDKSTSYFFADLYDECGNFIMRKTELFIKPKHFKWLKPNIKVSVKEKDGKTALAFSSDVFAKSVEIDFKNYDIRLSDNYIDLVNSDEYTIICNCELSAEELIKDITLKSVYDIK